MSIYIVGAENDRNRIAEELKKLHPNISILDDHRAPNRSFALQVVPGGDELAGGECLQTLLSSKKDTVIYALPGPDTPGWTGSDTIGDLGGGSSVPLSESGTGHLKTVGGKNGAGAMAMIAVDASDNNGNGYYTFDGAGRPINDPLFAILANELSDGHAYQFVTGSTPRSVADAERKSIEHENQVRDSAKPPKGEKPYAKRGLTASAGPVGTGGITTRPPNSY